MADTCTWPGYLHLAWLQQACKSAFVVLPHTSMAVCRGMWRHCCQDVLKVVGPRNLTMFFFGSADAMHVADQACHGVGTSTVHV